MSSKAKREKPDLHILTVPHSGTRYVLDMLLSAGADVAGPTQPYNGEAIHVCHWYAPARTRFAHRRISILREPIAVLVSHWATAHRAPAFGRTIASQWRDLLGHVELSWERMLERGAQRHFAVENYLDVVLALEMEAQNTLPKDSAASVVIDFLHHARRYEREYPLKQALRDKDARAIRRAVPKPAWSLFTDGMPPRVRRLYENFYDFWWMP